MKDHTQKTHHNHAASVAPDPVAKKQEVASETIQHSQGQAQEYLNQWKRAQADFENYRKDEAKRMAEVIHFANKRMILEVADVIDNLEMTFKHAPPDTDSKWLEGARHVFNQWHHFLGKSGIKRIEAVGKEFDPKRHEAVSGQGEKVVEEIRAGYETDGEVIRPARVKLH